MHPGELVFYQGILHLCTIPTATSFGAQSNYWEDFVDGIDFVGDWVSGLDYGEGALVKYSGNVYLCKSA